MKSFEHIIEFLESVKRKGVFYFCHSPTAEGLIDYLSGFSKSAILSNLDGENDLFIETRSEVITRLGLSVTARNPIREMRENGISEKVIISQILDIEIETWKTLDTKLKKNLA